MCGGLLLLHFSAHAKEVPTVRHVDVLSSGSHLEIEITTSEPLTPQTQIITGPDRLIVDFPGALPDARLHNLAVNRGEVKGVRVGLFTRTPPTTRLVFDMKSVPQYQIFPSGRTLIVKLGASLPGSVPADARVNSGSPAVLKQVSAKGIGMVTGGTVTPLPVVASPPTPAASAPDVRVQFDGGKLSIWADKATLASVLYEIQRRTGAEVSIPPSASQEKIVADIPPSPAREAIAALLDGSNFDFILMGSDKDPQALHSIILTTRGQDSASSDQAFFPAVQSPPDSQPLAQPDVQDAPPSDVQSTPEPQPDMVPERQPPNPDPQN